MAKAGLLFVGSDDGLVLFSNPNNIGRWLRIGQPFRGKTVGAVWPLADNPLVVLAAVVGAGLQRSEDGGQSWLPIGDAEAISIVGAHSDTQRLYFGTPGGAIYRSGDGGSTWQACAPGGWPAARAERLVVAEGDPDRVYVGLDDGSVWASRDAGVSWQPFAETLGAPIAGLAETRGEPGELLAVAGGALYRGSAAVWQPVEIPESAAGPLATLGGQTPAWLVAKAGGGIARSDDRGASWTAAGQAELAISALAPASYHVDQAFGGTTAGQLLFSADRGRSWQVLKQDLAPIRSIGAARLI